MTSTTAKRIGRHVAALFFSTCVLGAIPVMAYAAQVIGSGDPGGPLNLILVPLLSVVLAGAVSVFVFLPLSLFAEQFGFQRWMRFTGISTVALTITCVIGWICAGATNGGKGWAGFISMLASMGLFLVGGFLVYLCCIAVCRKILP